MICHELIGILVLVCTVMPDMIKRVPQDQVYSFPNLLSKIKLFFLYQIRNFLVVQRRYRYIVLFSTNITNITILGSP